MKQVPTTWNEFFKSIENEEFCLRLHKFLDEEYSKGTCYPKRENIFNAFKQTKLSEIKVVIIGQDPYHEPNQAMGLSFSVPKGVKLPPSLINIYKEIENEYQCKMNFASGDLTYLTKQGVLLINSILSVRENQPLSHNIEEYKMFFEKVLEVIDKQKQPIVYLMWGNYAKNLKKYLHNPSHCIYECAHPSPLAANRGGWFNSGIFLKANQYLIENKVKPINWCNKK